MERLKNITVFWNLDDKRGLEDNDMFQGTILVGDDGWFEGVVYNASSDAELKMVYGVYHSDIAMELVRVDEKSNPVIFRASNSSSGYYKGDVFADTLTGEVMCGDTRIVTQDVNHYGSYEEAKRYLAEEKRDLERVLSQISISKEAKESYELAYTLREQISANLLENYFGDYPLEFNVQDSKRIIKRR